MAYPNDKQLLFAFSPLLLLVFAFSYVQKTEPTWKGHTIESRIYQVKPDGEIVERGTESTYISQTGKWRKVQRNAQNEVTQVIIADPAKGGVFNIISGQAIRMASFSNSSRPPTAERLKSNSQFVGEVSFLGLKAYAQRVVEDGRVVIEAISIPGITQPVKYTNYDEEGSVYVIEAVSIIEGEPPIDQVKLPANLTERDAILDPRPKPRN
ncbi:MAG TPA: hypothetical protein VMZ30_22375 [Pyrinomonadaceae bacterium]|nr:hypothetical protein [Pyrinomonadaceae bacterium]